MREQKQVSSQNFSHMAILEIRRGCIAILTNNFHSKPSLTEGCEAIHNFFLETRLGKIILLSSQHQAPPSNLSLHEIKAEDCAQEFLRSSNVVALGQCLKSKELRPLPGAPHVCLQGTSIWERTMRKRSACLSYM